MRFSRYVLCAWSVDAILPRIHDIPSIQSMLDSMDGMDGQLFCKGHVHVLSLTILVSKTKRFKVLFISH